MRKRLGTYSGLGMLSVGRRIALLALLLWLQPRSPCVAGEPQCGTAGVPKEKRFEVTDYGAVGDGRMDAGPGFRKAIAAAQAAGPGSVVRVPPGVWRLLPAEGEKVCVPVTKGRGLKVTGEPGKTQLVIAGGRCSAFGLNDCDETTIRGFTIDYDPVPFTQGTVVAVDTNSASFEMQIDPGYPSLGEAIFAETTAKYERWGMFMDPKTRWLRPGFPNFVLMGKFVPLEGGLWRLHVARGEESKLRLFSAGDLFVQLARGAGAAFTVLGSRACVIEDNIVYSSPTTSVTAVGCDRLTVRGLRACYKPGTNRLISTDADGVHCQQNLRGPFIESCSFEGMADDGINIYAPPRIVQEVLSPTEVVVSGRAAVKKGDRLQIIDPQDGRVRGETTVAYIEAVEGRHKLTFEQPVAGLAAGTDYQNADTIYNLTRCGAGYVIRSNQFNRFRGRGILLRAGEGLIEGNMFGAPSTSGIVLANEPDWPEGPIPWNILIRNNTFRGGGDDVIIRMMAFRLRHGLAMGRSLRGITIEGNRFDDPSVTAMYVGGARDVAIRSNVIAVASGVKLLRRGPAVHLANCQGVAIEDLVITDPGQQYQAVVAIEASVERGEAGVRITNVNVRNGGGPMIVDQRQRDPSPP